MLDVNDKKRVKEFFSDYLDSIDSRKQINDNIKVLKEEVAKIFDSKVAKVTKLFSFMRKKYEDGVDEIDEIGEMMLDLED